MRYPILSVADATVFLMSKRAGTPIESDTLVKFRGEGDDIDLAFVGRLQTWLQGLRKKYPDASRKGTKDSLNFEAQAACTVHEIVQAPAEVLADPDFWVWLAVCHCGETVEWRYGGGDAGVGVANYGIGSRNENLIYRLWLRADLVLDDTVSDRYHLCKRGQIDFYRSHLFRQGYANARHFARALVRFQYPHSDGSQPNLKVDFIRELVKRLRRLRSNLFVEVLDEDECHRLIADEATRLPKAI